MVSAHPEWGLIKQNPLSKNTDLAFNCLHSTSCYIAQLLIEN
jgi:hypothetical protein